VQARPNEYQFAGSQAIRVKIASDTADQRLATINKVLQQLS